MSYNLSKYTKTGLGFSSTSAFPGSTGTASVSDTFGFPTETTGFDTAGFDGIRAIGVVTNATGFTLQAYTNTLSSTAAIATGWTALSGGSISATTAAAGYSTAAFTLELDVIKPRNRFIAFVASVPSSSAVATAVVVDQYSARVEPAANGPYNAGSTTAVSLST